MGTRKLHSQSLIGYFRVKPRICCANSSERCSLSSYAFNRCALLVYIYQTICVDTAQCVSLGKEVIQPQVPLRLPCYDFTPVMNHKVVSALPKVKLPTSFATHSHGVTGGVYKARERIHRSILIYDY